MSKVSKLFYATPQWIDTFSLRGGRVVRVAVTSTDVQDVPIERANRDTKQHSVFHARYRYTVKVTPSPPNGHRSLRRKYALEPRVVRQLNHVVHQLHI